MSLQAATYNVNGRKPPASLDLQPWLAGGQGADIVAVGFQEIVPLSAGNVMTGLPLKQHLTMLFNLQRLCNTPCKRSQRELSCGQSACTDLQIWWVAAVTQLSSGIS